MTKDYIHHTKIFSHDVLKQPKPFYKQVKRLVIYKDNVPYSFDRKTGKWDYKLDKNQ